VRHFQEQYVKPGGRSHSDTAGFLGFWILTGGLCL
jgi:hypothetical protein